MFGRARGAMKKAAAIRAKAGEMQANPGMSNPTGQTQQGALNRASGRGILGVMGRRLGRAKRGA
jgi:hypothetical protein